MYLMITEFGDMKQLPKITESDKDAVYNGVCEIIQYKNDGFYLYDPETKEFDRIRFDPNNYED